MDEDLKKAQYFFQIGRYEDALKVGARIFDGGNRSSRLLHLLGLCCIHTNRFNDAKEFLHQAVIFDPLNEKNWLDLGFVFHKLGLFDQGLEAYSNSLQVNPDSALAFNGLAVIFAHCKDYNASMKYIRLANKIAPNDNNIKNNYAKISRIWKSRTI
ncbi:hypothetical protein CMK18_20725 [Candidatus Poribacteria bacterium]|nr:hypothetical protein [Candidatus Poribacteria bacterium]